MPSELNQTSSDPLYKQIMDDIVHDIDSGFYGTGERLPSEEDLRDIYRVSRVTIRRSIAELAKRGYLEKRQGKGTYVSKRTSGEAVFRDVDVIDSFTDTCRANGAVPGAVPVLCELVAIPDEAREFFGAGDEGRVLRIARVRTADGVPIMYEDNLFHAESCGFLLDLDLRDKSLFNLIEHRTGLVPTSSRNGFDLNICRADAELSRLMDISTKEPMFYVHGRYLDQFGNPLFFGKQFMVGKRYSFRL